SPRISIATALSSAVAVGFSTKADGFRALVCFHDKANPIRRVVIRRESHYKPHCCPSGLRVSSLGAQFAVPRQSVALRHKRRPKCDASLDRYYLRLYWLVRLIERYVYCRVLI